MQDWKDWLPVVIGGVLFVAVAWTLIVEVLDGDIFAPRQRERDEEEE